MDKKTDILEFYLFNSHHFVHQPRSSLTDVQRGGGVGIWAPKQLTVKMRNDLNTIKRSFLSQCGLKMVSAFNTKTTQ